MELIHGGDIAGFRRRYGREPLDFSASLNPLGMPVGVAEAVRRAVAAATPYPDPLCRELADALAERLRVPASFILCGNGAADVIYRFVWARKPRLALMPAPTFAEYARALESFGCRIRRHFLPEDAGFLLDAGFLGAITPDIDAVLLCQPNNPTGRLIDPGLLDAVVERCGETGASLFVDECFLAFAEGARERSLAALTARRPHLVVLDSFTKLYGMAGIRLGYAVCGDADLVDAMRLAGQPWPVSSLAQAAGLAALAEGDFVKRSLALVRVEKEWLANGLAGAGLDVIGADANYLFFSSKAFDLHVRLAERGISIRDCANFPGLRPGHFRVCVRIREDNETLVRAIRAIFALEE